MDMRKNLNVPPSNDPNPAPSTAVPSTLSDSFTALQSQICQKFNRGAECRVCDLQHVCSVCEQPGHTAQVCQAGILRVTSGNTGTLPLEPGAYDTKLGSNGQCTARPPPLLLNPPSHATQALRVAQKRERRNIWQRWELNSQRYLAYRRKARSKKPGTKEDVWPDHVEEAFQIAIRLYAKRGRTKDELNGKQAGGNEFISAWIKKTTGVHRCRKQISSHIQTLKGFLADVPNWMHLVTAWPAGKNGKEKILDHSDAGLHDLSELVKMSNVPRAGMALSRTVPSLKTSHSPTEPGIRNVSFDMHLRDKKGDKIHMYTSVQAEIGSSPKILEGILNWRAMFPELALKYSQNRIECPLFSFEARMNLIDEIPTSQTTSLGIEFLIDFTGGIYYQDWRSYTRVHKQGFSRQAFDDAEFDKSPRDDLECAPGSTGHPGDVRLIVPFKSKWWVKLFSSIMSKKVEARQSKDREAIKWAEEYPNAFLRELSIMQEIWASPRIGVGSRNPQRMAILLWTFSQTRNGEAATTTWRPLKSSLLSPVEVQEPHMMSMQPTVNLDSAVQASMALQAQQSQDPFFQELQQEIFGDSQNLIGSHASNCDDEPTTPLLDYQSFPSSTSTSFPSSISSSTYAPQYGSSFDSHDSCFSSSIDGTIPHNHDHHSYPFYDGDVFKSHPTSSYDSQDSIYESNPASTHENMPSYTPFDKHGHASDEDQMGDRTQSSLTRDGFHFVMSGDGVMDGVSRQQDDVYDAPLIAPRANVIPQQQLEQQLENFERWIPPNGSLVFGSPNDFNNNGENVKSGIVSNGTAVAAAAAAAVAAAAGVVETCDNVHQQREDHDEEDRYLAEFHNQQQQQLEYYNDAHQYWQQSYHPTLASSSSGNMLMIASASGGPENQHGNDDSQCIPPDSAASSSLASLRGVGPTSPHRTGQGHILDSVVVGGGREEEDSRPPGHATITTTAAATEMNGLPYN